MDEHSTQGDTIALATVECPYDTVHTSALYFLIWTQTHLRIDHRGQFVLAATATRESH